jgi:K+-transporting ATPase ATPase C chain
MRKDLIRSATAVLVLTVLLGIAYPLLVTGLSQVVFPGRADGSLIHRNGQVIGSKLQAQAFNGAQWFHPRPSQTNYSGSATFFSNRGPNQASARAFYESRLAAYLKANGPYDPGLKTSDVPVDAVTTSASGVDPHISQSNARIQARRVAAVRHLPVDRVLHLVDDHTDGRALGVLGEPGVNVLELNLALDQVA